MVNRADEIRVTVVSADDIVHDRTYAHRDIRYRANGPGSHWLRV